ncbi:MAG TPA: acetoacetate--CoA ligase [Acidimicrobiales bacterium]
MPPIWAPSPERAAGTKLAAFARALGRDGYESLHDWSVADPGAFWAAAWDTCGVVGTRGATDVVSGSSLSDARFFPDARLNVVETFLATTGDGPALIEAGEDGRRRTLSWDELRAQVASLAAALTDSGVGPGHRVAAWLPNIPETVITMLATAAVGATFSSTSPDFGPAGVLDRFGQIEPTVLVACDGYVYGGKANDCLPRLAEIRAGLPSVRRTIVVPYLAAQTPQGAEAWSDVLAAHSGADLVVDRHPFDHPWYVLYSSGTTGKPKAIIHRAGGVLLKHLVEHQLHCDVRPGDRMFYFTTAGWMMWNWLVSGLASGATLVLYDGSPSHPPTVLFDLADEVDVSLFGTSAKFIDAIDRMGLDPARTHDLGSVRTITSTGSPLAPEGFDYVYEHVKGDVHLASISGGTDLCGCLVAGDPSGAVHRGEIQRPALALDIDVVDEAGTALPPGEKGELICRTPFPSMPLGFWGDDDGSRYQAAYFERIPGAWHQGDFAAWTEHGGLVIHGRSDATLNPGGVRIGTAEIYRQVEQVPEVAEAIAVGQETEGDTRIVLFVVLRDGEHLDDDLRDRIRRQIRANTTPRHVPAKVIAVPEIPRTRSGKITELAVRAVIHGDEVGNVEALANPEALDHYRDLPELAN